MKKNVFRFKHSIGSGALILLSVTGCINPVKNKSSTVSSNYHPGISVDAANSTLSVHSKTVVSGETTKLTFTALDQKNDVYRSSHLPISFEMTGGTSTGKFSDIKNNKDGTYTITFTGVKAGTPSSIVGIVDGHPLTSEAPHITVTPGAMSVSHSTVSVSSPQVGAGLNIVVTVTARDENDNQVPTATGLNISLSAAGGTSTGTFGTVTDNLDGTYSATFTGNEVGTPVTINATIDETSITSNLPTVTVAAGAVSMSESSLTVTSSTVASGSSTTLTFTAKDVYGNQQLTGGLNVSFSNSTGANVSTGTVGAVRDNNDGTYTATFAGVLAGTASPIRAFVDSSPLTSALPTVTVTPGPAVALQVVGFPSAVTAGSNSSISVSVVDLNGNKVKNYDGSIAFSSSDPNANLPSTYTFGPFDNGSYIFSGLALKTAGLHNITVSDLDTGSVTGTQSGITVLPGDPSTFSFTGLTSVTRSVWTSFNLTALDSYGNIATGYTGRVRFTTSDSNANKPSNYTFTDSDSGVKVFNIRFKTVGTQSLTATDTSSSSVTGTQSGIDVSL